MTTKITAKSEISVAEAADLMRCSESSVRRLIESGEIEAYRLTPRGHYRVSRDSVVRYLARLSPTYQ